MAPESLLGTHRLPLNLFQLKTCIVNRITLVHALHQHGHGSFYSKLDSRASPASLHIVSESFCVTVLVPPMESITRGRSSSTRELGLKDMSCVLLGEQDWRCSWENINQAWEILWKSN